MRNVGWTIFAAVVLGGLFWPFLWIFGAFMLIVIVVGILTGRKGR
jgi:hypothetical protein